MHHQQGAAPAIILPYCTPGLPGCIVGVGLIVMGMLEWQVVFCIKDAYLKEGETVVPFSDNSIMKSKKEGTVLPRMNRAKL